VRASSILRKAGELPDTASYDYDLASHEIKLIDMLSRFPAAVHQSALEYKPLHMANYTYELASTFHSLYHVVPVLQSESSKIREARLRLVAAARQTLSNALRLLDIEAPDVM
jgi:arginyl-tRNA synthetase